MLKNLFSSSVGGGHLLIWTLRNGIRMLKGNLKGKWYKDVEMDLAFPKGSFPTNVWLLTRVLAIFPRKRYFHISNKGLCWCSALSQLLVLVVQARIYKNRSRAFCSLVVSLCQLIQYSTGKHVCESGRGPGLSGNETGFGASQQVSDPSKLGYYICVLAIFQ